MCCVSQCFINPCFNYLWAQMSLCYLILRQISNSLFIMNLTIIMRIGKVSLSVLLREVVFDSRHSSGSRAARKWFNASAILFSLCIIGRWSVLFDLRWHMSTGGCFESSVVVFVKKDCCRWEFSIWLGVVSLDSHVLNTLLDVIVVVITHDSLGSLDDIWVHSISVGFHGDGV